MALPRIGISLGDPSGIGPLVTAKALRRPQVRRALTPVVFGDEGDRHRFPATVEFIGVSKLAEKDRRPGVPSRHGGRAQFEAIDALITAAKAGEVDALCTAPVSKEWISRAGVPFMGHTEVLAEAFDAEVVMLMKGPRLSVALATNHLPLARVPKALTVKGLVRTLAIVDAGLSAVLGRRPTIAVCGLNPHAGEGGLLGREEVDVIVPAMKAARRRGLSLTGPHGADGLFAHRTGFDVALAMFHDQGLVATKTLDFVHTVNVTLGLPVPRTSPDHGTAYALATSGEADETPMVSALLEAARFVG
ncbi:MAG: 4-hydroxythreonine-4-phosphate dehydrogenase PdxA [Myxococcaceae bacterium]|nr:4-hydroxythreonine-4-phosphate dehydrogenase PdxA [Myxococcaceae bacterium]